MEASRFIGRVGGLAVALGIGAAAFVGAAVASADTPDSGSSAGAVRDPAARAPRVASRGVASTNQRTLRKAPQIVRPVAATQAATPTGVPPAATLAPPTLPATTRRRASTPAHSSSPQAAATTADAAFGTSPISVDPTVVWNEGVLSGTLNATSDQPLSYSVVSRPSGGGKLGGGPLLPLTNFGKNGEFTYVPYASTLTDATQTETFKIMVLQNSPLDQFVEHLLGPLGELLVPQVLAVVHRIPIVGDLLSPIIGAAKVVTFTVNPYTEAAGRPTAFTYKMPSFDGTLISVNYFPALNVADGSVESAPTVMAASGLACAANTDPSTKYGQLFPSQQFGSLTPGIAPLRSDSFTSTVPGVLPYNGGGGYNVITWDPRGEFASDGQLQIDNPFFEGRDVSAIISWLTSAANPAVSQVKTAPSGDPLVGMTGGSYGGGIQLTTVDPRIDAIVPEIAWNSLLGSLYPDSNQFKTGFGSILAAALAFTGARVNPAIYAGIITGVITGYLTPSQQAVLGSVGPTTLLNVERAATLLFQGIEDVLFPLSQSVDNAATILANPYATPVKMVWFCGGHGTCNDPVNPKQDARGIIDNLRWLDQYVAGSGTPADEVPAFQWYDQNGDYWTSPLLPFQTGFNQPTPYTASGTGGVLGLGPIIGGSGPWPLNDLPFAIANAGPAWNALNVDLNPSAGSQIVGSPTVRFTYAGLGTSRTVYAQIVDKATGLVLGNNVTPIPVILDGRTRTVSIPIEDIVYTATAGGSLLLQITSSAINYENFTTLGIIAVSGISVDLPIHAAV